MWKIARLAGIWLVTLLLALVSVRVGIFKFAQAATWDRMLARWGYPTWVRPIIGGVEVVSGLLVLAPPLAAFGAIGMGAMMVGAIGTHVVHGELDRVAPPLVLLTLSAIVFAARRPVWLRRRASP
jgi:putative oxidoreductase